MTMPCSQLCFFVSGSRYPSVHLRHLTCITGIIADGSSNCRQLGVRGYSTMLIRMRAHVCTRLANYPGAIETIVLWIGGYGGARADLDIAAWNSVRVRNQTQLVDSNVCDWGIQVSYRDIQFCLVSHNNGWYIPDIVLTYSVIEEDVSGYLSCDNADALTCNIQRENINNWAAPCRDK